MSAHALLSASSAHRWLNCTPSARLEAELPDTTSDAAAEGTLAHAIAELKLRKYFLEPMGPRTFTTRMNKLKKDPLYQDEMQEHTDTYFDYVKEATMRYDVKPLVTVEKKLDYSLFAPEGFGTGDCILLGGDTLHVIDFKYGRHVLVSAEDNPQMKLYALGAISLYAPFYPIQRVIVTIVQPRGDGIKEWETTKDELLNWGQFTVKPLAQQAFEGKGEFQEGDWCRFCRARGQCRKRSESLPAVAVFGQKLPPLLSDAEVGDALEKGATYIDWYCDLEKYALSATLSGKEIPGWKAVAGRSNRQFKDVDKAFTAIQATGVDEALLYERRPIPLTAVETLIGKAEFAKLVPEHVYKPQGKPTLVPISDPRVPFQARPSAQEAFTNTANHKGE